MNRLTRPGERPELKLESRAYQQIPNAPTLEPDNERLQRFAEVQQARHGSAELRRIAGHYNCFGLAFGSRRTSIGNVSGELSKIYSDDSYRKIAFEELTPGDLVMYLHNGTIEHVATVLSLSLWTPNRQRSVKVLSKWGHHGPEFIHEMTDFELGKPTEFWTER
jgi:hypothetical protein